MSVVSQNMESGKNNYNAVVVVELMLNVLRCHLTY